MNIKLILFISLLLLSSSSALLQHKLAKVKAEISPENMIDRNPFTRGQTKCNCKA